MIGLEEELQAAAPIVGIAAANKGPGPAHLTSPSPEGWAFWRTVGLRAAGFPADGVLALAHAGVAGAADALNLARDEVACQQAGAQTRIAQAIDALMAPHQGVRPPGGWPAELTMLRRAAQQLAQERDGEELSAALPADTLQALAAARCRLREALQAYGQQDEAASVALREAVRAVARDARFREAVTWQNHAAVRSVLDALAEDRDMPGAKRKQREDLVASYLQRYSLKNDTIGFFGPVGWAHVGHASVACGDAPVIATALAERTVYFEDWPIAALARQVAADDRYIAWTVPRLQPFLRIEGQQMVFPGGARVALSAEEAMVLRACDGRRSARDVALGLLANPFSQLGGEPEVFALLRRFEAENRLELTFPVPTMEARPERALAQQFERIDDGALRQQALDALAELEAARHQVSAAAGDPGALQEALVQLDATYARRTGLATRRGHGDPYAGRALVYEDCRREGLLALDETWLHRLQQPLDMILHGARWFTVEVAKGYRTALAALLRTLAPADGRLDLPTFWSHAHPLFFQEPAPVHAPMAELTRRWATLLPPLQGRRIQLDPRELATRVREAFRCDAAAWTQGRYQSPDVMLCREDGSDSGPWMAVLGEVHVGGNTLLTNGFVWQHPDPQALLDARRADLGCGHLVPKLSGAGSQRPIRTQAIDDPAFGREVMFSRGAFPTDPKSAVLLSELEVVGVGDSVQVRHRRAGWTKDILELLGDFLFLAAGSKFRLVDERPHVPRITLGDLVIQRETWKLPCSRFSAALAEDDAGAFVAARRLRDELGLPRHVFVKVPWENKPFFVDFDSPVFVRSLVKQLRNALQRGTDPATQVSVGEMLPGISGLWLRDAAGRRYTSELRWVALDQQGVTE